MPNWCDTTYRAVGKKEQVKKFYDLALSSWNKSKEDNSGWLGHFVTELGGNWEEVHCRGWMQDEPQLSDDGETCEIYCNTAWGELYEWRTFIEEHIDGLFLFYVAIEPGCGVYCSNDDMYEGKYYIDAGPEQPDNPFMTEDEVCEFVEKHYQANVNSIHDCSACAVGINGSNDDDAFLYINEMKVYND